MSANLSNVSGISTLINGVMNETTTSGNRSAALIVEVFKSEATFSKSAILNVMRKTGVDRTDAVDTVIKLVSDDFKRVHDAYGIATHKDHKAKLATDKAREANAFEAASYLAKIKAARVMVTRVMQAVYFLRERECSSLTIKKFGASYSLVAKITDDEGDAIKVTKSVAELIREGEKLLSAATGKQKADPAKTAAKNPVAHQLADTTKALSALLTGFNSKEVKPITDFSGETSDNMETTLKQLFMMKFFDGKTFDNNTFVEWLQAEFGIAASAKTKKVA